MSNKTDKPYVLRAAEFVYSNIIQIKKQNPEINNIQAFEIFMTTKEYDILSSGEFHDKWFLELKNNKFIAGLIAFAAAFTSPILTSLIALFTDFF